MDIPHAGRLIAPLLLIPFVENAFKHGAEQQERAGHIAIHAALKGNDLYFEVINTAPQAGSAPGGTGLDNVKKRLQYLYPGGHQLETGWSDGRYIVKLTVIL
jgi:LytS/YehU family sensor histidine kinase